VRCGAAFVRRMPGGRSADARRAIHLAAVALSGGTACGVPPYAPMREADVPFLRGVDATNQVTLTEEGLAAQAGE